LRNLHTCFHSGYTNLHFYQQCMKVPFSSRSCQHLLLFVFLVILIVMGWNLRMWIQNIYKRITGSLVQFSVYPILPGHCSRGCIFSNVCFWPLS
jgi:hypothetical protein